MTTAFYVVTGIFLSFLTMVIYGWKKDIEPLGALGFIGLILTAPIGYGVYGGVATQYTEKEKLDVNNLEKTEYRVILNYGDNQLKKFKTIRAYKRIDSTTTFYKIKKYNMYNINHKIEIRWTNEVVKEDSVPTVNKSHQDHKIFTEQDD